MPTYIYKVRDKAGKVLQGQMDATDGRDLRKKLDERDYFIIEYEEKKSGTEIFSKEIIPTARKIGLLDLSVFSWQLHTMLDAGLTLISSLKTIISQTKNEIMKTAVGDALRRVEEGASFSDALKEHPEVFSRFYVQMINAGEVGGVLDQVLERLAVYYERQSEITSKVKAAMIYPALLLTLSIGVVIFLVTVVLPQFANVFRDIGVNIPLPTQILLEVSVIIKSYWLIFIGVLAGMFLLLKIYAATERGRLECDKLKLKIPVIGELINQTLTARFTQNLATLVSGGIPILTALDVVTETIGNTVMVKVLKNVSVSVEEGKPIAQPLEESKVFPDMVVNMVRVGEEAGALDRMLDKIADFYDREVNSAIDAFTKLIEPFLMVFMAAIIGFIAISIFLPLADLLKNVRV